MKIHVCRRCDGSGHVTGGFHWEMPWTRWAPTPEAAAASFLAPHACPDCGGTGALIETMASAEVGLPSRRGLRSVPYTDHVSSVLRRQTRRARAN